MTNYHCEIAVLDGQTRHVHLSGGDRRLTFEEVLSAWATGDAMTAVFTELIATSPFDALFWEMPPLNRDRLDREYECVLIDSPALHRLTTNSMPFDEHFGGPEKVVAFDNLGADALMISPAPATADAQYPHLAAFCRNAAPDLSQCFWQKIGMMAMNRLGQAPIWISTAGLGVGWLHVRLDSRPKYYSYRPYRDWPERTGDDNA